MEEILKKKLESAARIAFLNGKLNKYNKLLAALHKVKQQGNHVTIELGGSEEFRDIDSKFTESIKVYTPYGVKEYYPNQEEASSELHDALIEVFTKKRDRVIAEISKLIPVIQ